MLDYREVKKVFAESLAVDGADGIGRFEKAFWEAVKVAYHKGVEDGEKHRDQQQVGINF